MKRKILFLPCTYCKPANQINTEQDMGFTVQRWPQYCSNINNFKKGPFQQSNGIRGSTGLDITCAITLSRQQTLLSPMSLSDRLPCSPSRISDHKRVGPKPGVCWTYRPRQFGPQRFGTTRYLPGPQQWLPNGSSLAEIKMFVNGQS